MKLWWIGAPNNHEAQLINIEKHSTSQRNHGMSPKVMQMHRTKLRRTAKTFCGRTQFSLMAELIPFDSDFGTIL